MSEQQNNRNNQSSGNNNNRRNNNRRRHYNNKNNQSADGQGQGPKPAQKQNPRPEGAQQQAQGNNPNNNNKKRFHNNRPRPQGGQNSGAQGHNLERTYEKYLNLLDQHLIARRKYHDLYFRADPNQKAKLEKNFYHSLNEVREFENRLTPESRVLFDKRNNGYRLDLTYATNHELSPEAEAVNPEMEINDPHLLQSQINCDYSQDTEESVGTAEDYLKYKGL